MPGRLGAWRTAFIVGVLLAEPTRSGAQIPVTDAGNLASNLAQYAKQLLQVKMQIQQLAEQLAAMEHLAEFPARDARHPLQAVSALMGQAGTLGYGAADLAASFRRYFTPTTVVQDWVPSQTTQAELTVDLMRRALASASAQQAELGPAMDIVARIQALNTGLAGHEQALELQNTALVYTAQELMLLRQQAMLQTNLQGAYYANELAREAQRDTTARAVLAKIAVPIDMGPGFSLRIVP